ncbi:Tether containing UBX domain for GLUT4 [Gryllus bimaculatus]|nr:Tether containing UBX domain for GLUT4 [Gryllus bimaculatus]
MATINCVTVLTPNGRRPSVKVTPNTTILQILEEVCLKHDFDPLEYDLRHHSRILDTTMTVQFSRLPNNAQLEMVKAKKIRRESEVLVNIQTESGDRLSGTFLPSESLWDVVLKLCPDSCVASKQPAILYMRQEICGMENLKVTTLRSLGLTSGRALLRLMCKTVEGELPEQQNMTSKLSNYPPGNQIVTVHAVSGDSQNPDKIEKPVHKKQDLKQEILKESPNTKISKLSSVDKTTENQQVKSKEPLAGVSGKKDSSPGEPSKSNRAQNTPPENQSPISEKQHQHVGISDLPAHGGVKKKQIQSSVVENKEDVSLEDIFKAEIEPRDRNPVIFKPGMRQPTSEDLPDEFFELTLNDVQNLYRELRSKRTELDESPLQTSAIRKLEESKRILGNLHKYKRAVLRIQFPNQVIVQGSFSPVETIASVQEFVKGYLQDSSISFYLYTTPPKEILKPSSRLIEVNCVPCALLHFGLPSGLQENVNYLKDEVMQELASPEAAAAAVTRSRSLLTTSIDKRSLPSTSGTQQLLSSVSVEEAPKDIDNQEPCSSKTDTKHAGNPNGKVPKWFKMGPK